MCFSCSRQQGSNIRSSHSWCGTWKGEGCYHQSDWQISTSPFRREAWSCNDMQVYSHGARTLQSGSVLCRSARRQESIQGEFDAEFIANQSINQIICKKKLMSLHRSHFSLISLDILAFSNYLNDFKST